MNRVLFCDLSISSDLWRFRIPHLNENLRFSPSLILANLRFADFKNPKYFRNADVLNIGSFFGGVIYG